MTCGTHMLGTVLDNVLDNVELIIKRNPEILFKNDLNFEFEYILNRNSDSKCNTPKIGLSIFVLLFLPSFFRRPFFPWNLVYDQINPGKYLDISKGCLNWWR